MHSLRITAISLRYRTVLRCLRFENRMKPCKDNRLLRLLQRLGVYRPRLAFLRYVGRSNTIDLAVKIVFRVISVFDHRNAK